MYKKLKNITVVLILILGLFSFTILNMNKQSYKCMVQLKNYDGEGAYIVVSLLNPDGKYNSTLWMMGEDEDWYEYFEKWWVFNEKAQEDIDAISGESIIGGERKQINFKVDKSLLDKGYKLRFESAVEDQDYHSKDVEIDFSSENFNKKIQGNGYIRYINIAPQ